MGTGLGLDILLSIKPEYANRIFDGSKRYEFRKRVPKQPIDKVYVYASAPVKKVIGYFFVDRIIQKSPGELWKDTKEYAGIDEEAYNKYFANTSVAYAIHVKSFVRYDLPIDPYIENPKFRPPQFFCYINGGDFE